MKKYIVEVYEDRTDWFNENGQFHRLDGPAIECSNGDKSWWVDGKLHRTDGPAVERSNGRKEWWVDGKELTEEEFNNRNKPCLGKKIVVDGVEYTLS
jgi:hypothetical protein